MSQKFEELGLSDVHGVFQFDIRGRDGGQWHAVCSGDSCRVDRGVHRQPDVTLTSDADSVIKLVEKKLSPTRALLTGKVKVKGNPLLIAKMRGLVAGRNFG